jgi:hypothetical protein
MHVLPDSCLCLEQSVLKARVSVLPDSGAQAPSPNIPAIARRLSTGGVIEYFLTTFLQIYYGKLTRSIK